MKEVIIDGAVIQTKDDLHDTFAKELSFPSWYGRNLDALYDCLTDLHEDVLIRLEDFDDLEEHLPIYARIVGRIVRRASRENPHITYTVDRDEAIFDDDEEDD